MQRKENAKKTSKGVEHIHMTPSGRLAPYPNMSDEDLDEFEQWAKETENRVPLWPLVVLLVLCAVIAARCVLS